MKHMNRQPRQSGVACAWPVRSLVACALCAALLAGCAGTGLQNAGLAGPSWQLRQSLQETPEDVVQEVIDEGASFGWIVFFVVLAAYVSIELAELDSEEDYSLAFDAGNLHPWENRAPREKRRWQKRVEKAVVVAPRLLPHGSTAVGARQGCSRQRLIDLGELTSSINPSGTIQFTRDLMVQISSVGGASLRQEAEYSVTDDAISYTIIRAIATVPGEGQRDFPVRNPGPHTEACSLDGGTLHFGDGTWS